MPDFAREYGSSAPALPQRNEAEVTTRSDDGVSDVKGTPNPQHPRSSIHPAQLPQVKQRASSLSEPTSSQNDAFQDRLEAFFSHLEVLKRPVPPVLSSKDAGASVSLTSLDDLQPGAARDFAVLLMSLAKLPAPVEGPEESATQEDARQAVRHLCNAITALDQASNEIRSFIRLSEPLMKQLARLAVQEDEDFQADLTAVCAKNRQLEPKRPPLVQDATLSELCEALAPDLYRAGTSHKDRRKLKETDAEDSKTLNPSVSIKSLIRLRNIAAHRALPSGAQLVPYLQTALTGMACVFTRDHRLAKIRHELATRGTAGFLVSEYLARVEGECTPRPPVFLSNIIIKSEFVPRRVTNPRKVRQHDSAAPLTQEESRQAILASLTPPRVNSSGLLSLLENHDRLWIKAVGGAGKSELLRGLAREIAQHPHVRILPIYIPVTHYRPGELLKLISRELGLRPGEDLPRLRRWQIALLLDGFNEVDRASQSNLLFDLKELEYSIGKHKICVSSRTDAPKGTNWISTELIPFDDTDIRNYLGTLEGASGALKVEDFWLSVSNRSYWEVAQENPLLLTMCAAYALKHPDTRLPESEAAIFQHLIDDYYEREVEKTPWIPEAEIRSTRKVFGELAWHSFKKGSLTLPETEVRELVQERLGVRSGDPYVTLMRTGLIERDGDEIRFIHQRLRDFLVGEYLTQDLLIAQEVEDDEPLTSPFSLIEKKLWEAVTRVCDQGPAVPYESSGTGERFTTANEEASVEWSTELLKGGGKILQYVLEFAPASVRTLYARELVSRELIFPIDQFFGGLYFSSLEAVCTVHRNFPDENLLGSSDLVAVFRRSWPLGQEFADFALYAIAASGIEGLAEKLADEIEVAPGVTLAEFPGNLKDKSHVRNLAHAMNFPSYWFFSLWRLEPEWGLSKLPSVLRFMTLSADQSDKEQIIMFLTRKPTAEVLERRSKAAIKSYIKEWNYLGNHDEQWMAAPVVIMLQNAPSYWELLYDLAAQEIFRSKQLYSLLDHLGQQFHEEFDDWDPWITSYQGSHRYMPPVGTFPWFPALERADLQQRIWDFKDKLAAKRGFSDHTDFY